MLFHGEAIKILNKMFWKKYLLIIIESSISTQCLAQLTPARVGTARSVHVQFAVRVQCVSHQHSVREFCSHHTKRYPFLLKCKKTFQESYIQVLYHATFDRVRYMYTLPMFICHSKYNVFNYDSWRTLGGSHILQIMTRKKTALRYSRQFRPA